MSIETALVTAFTKNAPRELPIGCCRVYVTVPKEHAKAVAAAARKIGKTFQAKAHYDMSNALYIGYDNHDGYALALGTAVVNALRSEGVAAVRHEHGD